MKNVIRVKQDHIDNQDPASLKGDAIALALIDAGYKDASFDSTFITADTVRWASKEIRDFWRAGVDGKEQKPFKFRLSDLTRLNPKRIVISTT